MSDPYAGQPTPNYDDMPWLKPNPDIYKEMPWLASGANNATADGNFA